MGKNSRRRRHQHTDPKRNQVTNEDGSSSVVLSRREVLCYFDLEEKLMDTVLPFGEVLDQIGDLDKLTSTRTGLKEFVRPRLVMEFDDPDNPVIKSEMDKEDAQFGVDFTLGISNLGWIPGVCVTILAPGIRTRRPVWFCPS